MSTIELYTFTTPNGRKPLIMLEEIGLPYTTHAINIGKGDQFKPAYVAINPNSKIPAMIDRETDLTIFESGAILIYLAEKSGKLLPTNQKDRFQVLQWLMLQIGSIGPMFGQLGHFKHAAEKIPYAIDRYETETLRLFSVLNSQLTDRTFIAGDEYSIADIATYPWIANYERLGLTLDEHPQLKRWVELLQQRPAVQKGMTMSL